MQRSCVCVGMPDSVGARCPVADSHRASVKPPMATTLAITPGLAGAAQSEATHFRDAPASTELDDHETGSQKAGLRWLRLGMGVHRTSISATEIR